MSQPDDQLRALLDTVRALDEAGIAYALIGGIAVGIHSGVPRATEDVDLAVPAAVARDDLVRALTEAGFAHTGTFEHSLNFRHSSGEPVQVAFDEGFDAMVERAEAMSILGASVRVVTRDDLIAMKLRAADDPARRKSKALRDRADVEMLRGDVGDPDEGW